MMQRLIIAVIRIITNTFFRRIDVVGAENIPADGAVIFVGNHPNALMDGWLLLAKCGRWPLHFVANAKLWKYSMLVPILNATGAIPVYRHEEHKGKVDNQDAFEKLYQVLESGDCMGIFPEGVSHTESKLIKLKTGAARIALAVTERGNAPVTVIPCGLNYIHRHRFRSQVLIEFGEPMNIEKQLLLEYRQDEQKAVKKLTRHLTDALANVTLNAPDWRTLRFIQTARRLYKPASVVLSPADYVELNRRFMEQYLESRDDPDLQALQAEIENYQARLDMLGLKDHQLRQPVSLGKAFGKIIVRAIMMFALLPLAVPGALLHLPIGWIAAAVGEKFSYEMDDVATLKVLATILLLPVMYIAIAIFVGFSFGFWWAMLAIVGLTLSFSASVQLVEAEASLLVSMMSILRLARLGSELDQLRATRIALVSKIRSRVARTVDPDTQRMFTDEDFA